MGGVCGGDSEGRSFYFFFFQYPCGLLCLLRILLFSYSDYPVQVNVVLPIGSLSFLQHRSAFGSFWSSRMFSSCASPVPDLQSSTPSGTRVGRNRECCPETQPEHRVCSPLWGWPCFWVSAVTSYESPIGAEGRVHTNSFQCQFNITGLTIAVIFKFMSFLVHLVPCHICSLFILPQLFTYESLLNTHIIAAECESPQDNCRWDTERSLRFLCCSSCP